jgi:hypothetical protein
MLITFVFAKFNIYRGDDFKCLMERIAAIGRTALNMVNESGVDGLVAEMVPPEAPPGFLREIS